MKYRGYCKLAQNITPEIREACIASDKFKAPSSADTPEDDGQRSPAV